LFAGIYIYIRDSASVLKLQRCCKNIGRLRLNHIYFKPHVFFFIKSLLLLFFLSQSLLLYFSPSLLLPLGPLQRRHILLLSFTCLFLRLFPSQMSFPLQTRSHLPFLLQQKNYASMKFQEETLEQEISKGLFMDLR
jgi:hypothetical protein